MKKKIFQVIGFLILRACLYIVLAILLLFLYDVIRKGARSDQLGIPDESAPTRDDPGRDLSRNFRHIPGDLDHGPPVPSPLVCSPRFISMNTPGKTG